jgi:hypothetical protein
MYVTVFVCDKVTTDKTKIKRLEKFFASKQMEGY